MTEELTQVKMPAGGNNQCQSEKIQRPLPKKKQLQPPAENKAAGSYKRLFHKKNSMVLAKGGA